MPTTTPKRVSRVAKRITYVTAPTTLATLAAWGFELLPDARPALVFMVYQLQLLVTLSAGMTWALAHGQVTIARAFAAGYNTALAVAAQTEPDPDHPDRHHPPPMPLRLVE